MNPFDLSRMWRLYRMAEHSRTGEASYTLRAAALDGIESEMRGHDCMAWLREVLHPSDVLAFVTAGMHVISVRDRPTGGFRGASHVDLNHAAAATIARHLPYAGLIPTCGDDGRPEVCPHDGQPCGGECPAFDPCHPAPLPPDVLASAMTDRVHVDIGRGRPVVAGKARLSREGE